MSKYFILQNQDNCIGCHSCEVQCKSNKSLPPGPKPCQIIHIGPKLINGKPKASFIFMNCHHCSQPWCIEACPTKAMQKRDKDGIVFIDHAVCVGCKTCITACPWGAPQWNPIAGKVVKCDLCYDRLDLGLKPACVTVCTTHCLTFDLAERIPPAKRELWAQKISVQQGAL